MRAWITTLTGPLETVTPVGWTAIGIAVLLFALYAWISIRRRRSLEAGTSVDKADRLLLFFALAFVAVIFGSFMIGTFEGSSAFGVDKLGWTNWQKAVPWGSLDAGSIGFSLLAIRAIRKERSPKPALRVVFLTAGMSATIQMMEGGKEHHWQAGLFLAFLAGVSAYALHIVIDQLRKVGHVAVDMRVRKYPPFGMRWLTSLPSTLCAWLAWVNYPPLRITPTVANALVHLDSVRAAKRARMVERPIWWIVQPWLYASRTEQSRAELVAESVRLTEQVRERTESLSAANRDHEHREQELREQAERDLSAAVQAARTETEQFVRGQAEQTIAGLREQIERLEVRRAPDPRPQRTGQVPVRPKAEVSALIGDEQIAKALFRDFAEQTEQAARNGTRTPGRGWVERNGGCHMRQALRVLDMLENRFAEQNRTGREQASGQFGEPNSEQSGADDPEREQVAIAL
jgi:TRAP-type C4-dicarboxylate transport system permease small subunit